MIPFAPLPLSGWDTAPCLLVSTPPWWVAVGREAGRPLWGDGFLMGEPPFKLCKVEAGQFQRDFFSVPPTDARVRGKGDHGGVKTIRADSNAPCLDLRAFLGGVGGHSLALQRMVPHVHAPMGLPCTPIQTPPASTGGWFLVGGTAPQAV